MNITSFLVYCVIVTFTPGPTNVVILSTVHNFGTKKALEFAYGATIAFGLLLGISALLNTVLVTVIPKILLVMQIIGSIYMLYLAYQIAKMNLAESSETHTATFISGFLMQFVNPKAVLFTLTVIPNFVMPYYTTPPMLAMFVIGITIIGFASSCTWVVSGTIFKRFLQKYRKIVNLIMALFLVYSAVIVSGIVELIKG